MQTGLIEAFELRIRQVALMFNVIPTGKEIGAYMWKRGADRGGGDPGPR